MHESRGSAAADWEWGSVPTSVLNDGDESIASDQMERLGQIFTTTEIEKMIEQCRMGRTRQKDLACVIEVSERTLRSRVRDVRALQHT